MASTIKPFLAISALSNNIINASDQIEDTGQFQVNEHSRVFHDWKPDGHGLVNLKKALMVSCDTYFYQLGVSMGIDLFQQLIRIWIWTTFWHRVTWRARWIDSQQSMEKSPSSGALVYWRHHYFRHWSRCDANHPVTTC